MGTWSDHAQRVIAEVHQRLPDRATLAERVTAVDAAYPFGERAHSPYKTWLRHRREYLSRYGYQPKRGRAPESPLERLMRRASGSPTDPDSSPSGGSEGEI